MSRLHWLIAAAALIFVLLVWTRGCDTHDPPLANVSGRVTIEGEPVSSAIVSFVLKARDDVRPAMALTDADGRYQILYSPKYVGAPIGENDVMVISDDSTKPKIPGRYSRPGQFTHDVKPGRNTIDLALTKKK